MLGKNFVSTSVPSSHTLSCQYLGIITRYWTRKIYEAILAKPWNGYWVSEWQGKTMITQKLVKHITGIWGNLPNCFSSILHCRLVGKAGPDVWLWRRPSEDVRSWNKITFCRHLLLEQTILLIMLQNLFLTVFIVPINHISVQKRRLSIELLPHSILILKHHDNILLTSNNGSTGTKQLLMSF